MKIEELRIGNLVLFENEIQEISSIHSDNTIRLRKYKNEKCHGCYKLDSFKIKPILLTKELLLNNGFEFSIDTFYLKGFSIWFTETYTLINDEYVDCMGFFYELRERGMMDKQIKHIHQLQNLYFSLTNKELTISNLGS
ncbi:hypothetical protein UFOVP600_38 [uncultured Caudovirales phage]|uniref:Uncharacterized protein n=1 Tax=uncultured Caudovirales phage TaxID=2100421 RepID=A0A6J5MYF1_9CAUD|nr:hypothetical protein UFOVP600_38 [uncultured Caudovirales phage]